MSADVFQLAGSVGSLVEQPLDAGAFRRFPIVVFVGPLGLDFDDQSFAVRIEFIGHLGDVDW